MAVERKQILNKVKTEPLPKLKTHLPKEKLFLKRY